jgi:hypothetical protein
MFAEHQMANAAGTRVPWAQQLTSPVAITTVLSEYADFVDSVYLGLSPL